MQFVSLQPAASPLDLVKVESDERLEVFKFSGQTWAADYDRESGRLAVTNDDVGILIYDIDETAKGRAGPVGALPTEGLPTAVCVKPMPTQRLLVIAGKKRPEVEVFDLDTFDKIGEVSAPNAKFLDYLGGNPNPEDPYVYYSTQRDDQDASRTFQPERLGRVNVNSMEAEEVVVRYGQPGRQSDAKVAAILFSDNGELLYLRDPHGGTTCVSFVTGADGIQLPKVHCQMGAAPTCAVGPYEQHVAFGMGVKNRYFRVHQGSAQFDIEAFFHARPLMVGFTGITLAFGSTNDYRAVASVPLPHVCLPAKGHENDFRLLARERAQFEAKFLKVFVDEHRNLTISVLPEYIVVAPLSRLDLPAEKSSTVAKRLPDTVYVNEQVTLELETEAEDVSFEVGDGRSESGRDLGKLILGYDGFDENLPLISKRTLTWTPSTDQIGFRTVHLITKQGDLTRDWGWDVYVEQPKSELPIFVTGVNMNAEGDLAAVWGQSPASVSESERKYYVGVFDVERRQLIQHNEAPGAIYSAAVDPSGVYASLNVLSKDSRSPTPSRLVRLSRDALKVESETTIDSHPALEVVAGKYLAGMGRWGKYYRFTIPDLKPVEPELNSYERLRLGGRLDDGWVWDGVLWDSAMSTPKLLLFPALFGVKPTGKDRGFIAGTPGMVAFETPGTYASTWLADTHTYAEHCTVFGYPGFLYVENGALNVSGKVNLLVGERPKSIGRSIRLAGSTGSRTSGAISCGQDFILLANAGQLTRIALDELLPEGKSFAIRRQQSTFVLAADKPTTVRYEAEDGVKYNLLVWIERPDSHFFEESQIKLQLESSDGTFSIELPQAELASQAVRVVKESRFSQADAGLDGYLNAVSPVFKSLVGREPQGVPFPIYVVVTAESEYGEKATLVHSYLVDVPREDVQGSL